MTDGGNEIPSVAGSADPVREERHVLEWLSPEGSGRMRGRQSFRTGSEAKRFMLERVELGSEFVSLHRVETTTFDVSDEMRSELTARAAMDDLVEETARLGLYDGDVRTKGSEG